MVHTPTRIPGISRILSNDICDLLPDPCATVIGSPVAKGNSIYVCINKIDVNSIVIR